MKLTPLFILLYLLFLAGPLQSAYLKNVETIVQQPDGTQLTLLASGDEYYNWLHDSNGYTIRQNSQSGYYCYAVNINDKMVATDYIVGKTDPASVGLKPGERISAKAWRERRAQFEQIPYPGDREKKQKSDGKLQIQNSGTINNIVIFIRFNDETEYTDQISTYNTMFNGQSTTSMREYFDEVSYGVLDISSSFYPTTSSVVVSYKDQFNRNYYEPYDGSLNPDGYANSTQQTQREHALLGNAVNYVSSQIPSGLNVDTDNDGAVDNVCFIISGSPGAWSSLLWPHKWQLHTYQVFINSKRVWLYNFQLQNFMKQHGIGVLCHEMFHSLSAPDLYHYTDDGMNPVGPWDVMCNTTTPPQHMCAYLKYRYGGWISSLPKISTTGDYTLNPVTSSTNNMYYIESEVSNEIYILEYRRKMGTFEIGLPGSGLLIYRMKTDEYPNGNRNGPPDEVYLFRPNGTQYSNGNLNNANFSADVGRTVFNPTSNPYPFLSDGTTSNTIKISNISTAGSTISFHVSFGAEAPGLVAPSDESGRQSLTPTFQWEAQSVDSYSLQVALDENFNDKILDETGLTTNSYTPSSGLDYGTVYYWRVKAVSSGGDSEWTSPWSFTTELYPPDLVAPDDQAEELDPEGECKWRKSYAALTYDIQIAEDQNFTNIVAGTAGTTDTTYEFSGLGNATTYYWRVLASDSYGPSEWSDVRSFTTVFAAPECLEPENEDEGNVLPVTFTWGKIDQATGYKLNVSKNISFTMLVVAENDLTDTTYTHDNDDLNNNTQYYWRVKAFNSTSESEWSEMFTFTSGQSAPQLNLYTNDTTGVATDGELSWLQVPDADSYQLQISENEQFSSFATDLQGITELNAEYSDLNYSTVYYWRVRAYIGTTPGPWSAVRSFRTVIGYPVIIVPEHEARGIVAQGTIDWEGVTDAESYDVQISSDLDFSALIEEETGIMENSYEYSELLDFTEYYLRVRTISGAETSPWSEPVMFVTQLPAPVLVSPLPSAGPGTPAGTIEWEVLSGATTYCLQVSESTDFGTNVIDECTISDVTYDYTGLQPGTTYYIRICGEDQAAKGKWCEASQFSIGIGAPALQGPANNSSGLATDGTLTWNSVSGADSYGIRISTSTEFSTTVVDESGLSGNSFDYSDLEQATIYYWQVSAETSGGQPQWSQVWSFTTISDSPLLMSPANNAMAEPVDGNLIWSEVSGADSYNLRLSASEDFGQLIIDEQGISLTKHEYTDLDNASQYYWKVSAIVNGTATDWSDTYIFQTIVGAPQLLTPVNNKKALPTTGKIVWIATLGATTYHAQISENADFSTLVANEKGLSKTEYEYAGLKTETVYYWRVSSMNEYGTSEWSVNRTFTTAKGSDVAETGATNLFTIYPNPADDELLISADKDIPGINRLELVNNIGQLMFVLSVKGLQQGNPVRIDVNQYPAGVYFVRAIDGNTIKSEAKLIIE